MQDFSHEATSWFRARPRGAAEETAKAPKAVALVIAKKPLPTVVGRPTYRLPPSDADDPHVRRGTAICRRLHARVGDSAQRGRASVRRQWLRCQQVPWQQLGVQQSVRSDLPASPLFS